MNETVIRLDDWIIVANQQKSFFAELDIVVDVKAGVSVIPSGRPVSTRHQSFAAAVKSGINSSLIISAMDLAPRNRCALPSRTITSAAGDRLL